MLVDTGASPSVVSSESVRKLEMMHMVRLTYLRTQTADNREMSIRGQITLELNIEGAEQEKGNCRDWGNMLEDKICKQSTREQPEKRRKTMSEQERRDSRRIDSIEVLKGGRFKVTFLVVDGLSVEALLGLGAMAKMGTRIDTKREMIEIGNLKYSYSEKRPAVKVAQRVDIAPNTSARIEVYAVGMRDGCYLAEDKLLIRGVGVEQKIMIIEVKNGKGLITIDNNSRFPVKI